MDSYYVYTHVHPETKETVYVGHGTGSRAWVMRTKDSNYGHRSEQHAAWFGELTSKGYLPSDWVVITHRNLNKSDACAEEIKLIRKHKPQLNKLSNPDYWQGNRTLTKDAGLFMKALRDSGYTYAAIAYLSGSEVPKNNVMSIKRNILYVA